MQQSAAQNITRFITPPPRLKIVTRPSWSDEVTIVTHAYLPAMRARTCERVCRPAWPYSPRDKCKRD